MNVHIPKVICLDCKKDMVAVEGTNQRICVWCDRTIAVEVVE